jgi:hypothetical protein
VVVTSHTTSSERKARQRLLEMLAAGQPAMLQVDMGFLPYFDFGGSDYHFGGHVVVDCGYDATTDEVLIADRDGMHPVPMRILEKARGSTFKPFPPRNLWYDFDFSNRRRPLAHEVWQAISEPAAVMLRPPISNIGVSGIRKTAHELVKWPTILSGEELRWALFNAYIFISPVGGTGGGTFRYMFSRFLREAAALTGEPRLTHSAEEFRSIGDAWEEVGELCHMVSEADGPSARLPEIAEPILRIADMEQQAWEALQQLAAEATNEGNKSS